MAFERDYLGCIKYLILSTGFYFASRIFYIFCNFYDTFRIQSMVANKKKKKWAPNVHTLDKHLP